MTKRFSQSTQQSPNPGPMAASSSLQDVQPVQSAMDLTTSTVELNVEQSSDTGIAEVASTDKGEYLDPKIVNEKITHATKNLAGIGQVPAIIQCTSSVANNLQSVSGTVNTFSVLLRPLKVFNTVANEITNVHLYMKVALSIFTCASKMILDQADCDDAVSSLLLKISEVYAFIMEKEELTKIESMLMIYGKIAQQTLKCADFISHYSETKNAWMRLGKYIISKTDATIQSYNNVLDSLMQQFQDR